MEKRFNRLATSFAFTALILASVVGICKQTPAVCGLSCSEQAMGAIHIDSATEGCEQNISTCSASIEDHMTSFTAVYPSVTANTVSLLSVAVTAFLAAWFLAAKRETEGYQKIKARLREFKRRISNSFSPAFLVFAYSQGILNSKIYA